MKFGAFLFQKMDNNSTVITKKVAVTFTLPNLKGIMNSISEKFQDLLSRVSSLAYSIYNPMRRSTNNESNGMGSRGSFNLPQFSNFFKNLNRKKLMKFGFPVVLGIILVIVLASFITGLPNAKSSPSVAGEDITVPDAISTIDLNRTFAFPLRDENTKEVGRFKFLIENAELKKQIIVQGKRATAVNGRIFLVFNLKIVNELKYPMGLPTRNYIRVIVNNNNELLAPDIHNDPVEVQPFSTKYTRLAIALDEEVTKKTIKVQVGEIEGSKQTIDLNFK